MKKWLAIFAAFTGVYLCFVIAFLPASFVANKIALPNNIQLGQVSGSIWNSAIDTVVIDGTQINNIKADVNTWSLFTFNPTINVTLGGALYNGPEGRFSVSGLLSSITITELDIAMNANEIAQQLTLPLPMEAKRMIEITAEQFVVGQPICQQLTGNVRWKNAEITAMSEKVALGTLSAALSCNKGKVIATLNEKNNLGVTFVTEIGARGSVTGKGYLTPHAQLPKAIEQVLPFLGRKDRQGRYRLAF